MDPGAFQARIRRCAACEHRRNAHASVWRWPRCIALDKELVLDNDFMAGPVDNCPLGLWRDLEPVDLDAERAAAGAKRLVRERQVLGPLVAALVRGLDEHEMTRRLLLPVRAGLILPETADAILEGDIQPMEEPK